VRLLRLDLLAYGPFTDHTLPLDEGQFGLHLVFGPNEAGKSSALRALRCLFYGIPVQCADAFVHPYPQLRIGAVLQDEEGETLHVIRRKAMRDTLRGEDDAAVVDPAQLSRWLGGIDETQFRLRFGIDHQELVRGGDDLVHGGGELGQALFAAGAGLSDLGGVQTQLAEDAEKLFQARGSLPRINKTLAELDAARKLRKESLLRAAEWTERMKQLREWQQEKAAVDARLAQTRIQRQRWERVRQTLPLAAKRQRLKEELDAIGDVPRLPDDFPDKRREAQTALDQAKRTLQESAATLSRIDGALKSLTVSDAVLGSAPLIQQLNQGLGAYQKAAKDRPRLVGQRDKAEEEALALLREVGRDMSLDQASTLQLSRAQRTRLRDLIAACQPLQTKLAVAAERLRDLSRGQEDCQAQLRHLEPPPSVDDLRRAVNRAQRVCELEQRCRQVAAELDRLQSQTAIDLQRLGLWSGPLESLETLPLPASETVDRFQAELAEADAELRNMAREQDNLQAGVLDLDGQIERLRLSQDALTEDDLTTARQRREAGWRLVQAAWLGAPSGDPSGGPAGDPAEQAFLAEFQPAEDLAQAYALSVERADGAADRLRRESARVAEKAQLMAERRKTADRLAALTAQLAARQQQRETLLDAWRQSWHAAGIEPLPPREMRAWLQRHAALAGQAADIRTRRAELAQMEARIAAQRSEVQQELLKIGEQAEAGDESLADLLDRSEGIANRLDERREECKQAARQLERLERQRPTAEQDEAAARQQWAAWRQDWAAAVAALGLPPEASPAIAQEVTAAIDNLLAKRKEVDQLRERVDGIDADAAAFDQRVGQICQHVGLDPAGLPTEQAVVELAARLTQTQEARTRQQGLVEQRDREEKRHQEAASQIDAMNAILALLCQEAGAATPKELPAIEQCWQTWAERERQLRDAEDHLLNLTLGGSLEDLLSEASQVDAAELDARLPQLAAEEKELDAQREQLTGQIAAHQQILRQMDGGDRAAEAEEQLQSLLARVRTDADEYIRLRLASVLLKRAIERYREKNQGPVLDRASSAFAALTRGSFRGLRADYDERGHPVLVGVRPDGRTALGVSALSEGTRDQLYLALRIASLEHYLQNNPPLPFIIDDVLIQFDDARAAAALQVLADLSERTQVIFFTHHEHLLDVARQHVAAEKLFVHRLDHAGDGPGATLLGQN